MANVSQGMKMAKIRKPGADSGAAFSKIKVDLPDLNEPSGMEPANVLALQPIYVAAQLEELKVFSVIDRLIELAQSGTLPLGNSGAFAVGRDIKMPADLKGKNIGVASIGGGNWMFTMLAFEHWGIEPKRDNITFRIIGNTGVRAQSIASGVIAGSMLGYTFATNLRRDGYPILADMADLNIPFQDSGLFTRKSFLAQHPETTEKVLRALVKAVAFIQDPANKNAVLKSMVQWLRLSKVEDAVEGYEFMRKMYTKRIYPAVDGIRNSLRVLSMTNEKFSRLKAEDLVDDRIVRKLEKEGLF
jgi:ABC-type nitrate/sulfonate/bicarbonate transport system substrate-binding protein